MAPSVVDDPSRVHSPADVEAGFYQPIPSRHWYEVLLDNLNPMPLKQRPHQYPHHRLTPARSSSSASSIRKQDIVTEIPVPKPEHLPSKKPQVFPIVKLACLVVPIFVLCFFGVLHIVQFAISGEVLVVESAPNSIPDWGHPAKVGYDLGHYPTDATRDVLPIPVHSHNDYWRRIPLYEALHYGCTGVEADVWHIKDDLFVGHSTSALTLNRTFRSLYVDPLIALLDKQNPQTEFANPSHLRNGVFDENAKQTLVLLVDLKTDGRTTFPVVEAQLEGLRAKGYLTYFNGTHTVPGAITVVGTGNTPFDILTANTTYRDIFYDAPLERLWVPHSAALADMSAVSDLSGQLEMETYPSAAGQGSTGLSADTPASAFNSNTSYYASLNFRQAVGRIWRGRLSHAQKEIIRGHIRGAKKAGLKARYWNTPAWPISLRNHVWQVLVEEGVGMLNADDLRGAATQDWRRWKHEWW